MTGDGPAPWPPGHAMSGARAAVATKHHKTATIARALSGPDGLQLQTAVVDTDALGTFTTETPRPGTPRHTVTLKAQWACEESGLDLGIGSEGSFFPHPDVGLITMQVEHVALVQMSTGLCVIGTAVGGAPWTVRRTIGLDDCLDEFRDLLSTGAQRLVARPAAISDDAQGISEGITKSYSEGISKGIADLEHLRAAVREAVRHSGTSRAIVETDLRAHHCPPRHQLIYAASQDLGQRLATTCTACGSVGYGRDESRPGAPCAWCAAPTATLRDHIYSCPTCHHTEIQIIPGSDKADPGTCPNCNP